MKLLISIIAAAMLWPFSIFAQSDSTHADITLLKSKRYQTMEDIGGNYCQARYRDHAWDEVGQFTLENLQPKYVRFALPLRKWEPENDNDRPNSIDLSKFQYNEVMLSLFDMLKTMKEEYGVVNFVASVWDGPTWMIANPEQRQQRKINPEMYREVLESVAAFMLVARDEYGVEIDYFSFNEATGGYQILFTPEEIIEFMKIGGPYFRKFGFKTNFLTADAHSTATCVEYAKPILATEELHPYLGPLSYHSWWSDRIGNDVFQEIADLADEYDLPVWCTELGYDAMLYKQEGDPYETWENGWRLAKVTHRAIKHSKATVTHYWTYQNNFPLLREADSPFPAYYAMKHFADYLPGGTTIVEAEKTDPDLWVFAGVKGQDYTMLNVLNTASYPKTITFHNLPEQIFHWIFTNEEGNMMQQRDSFAAEAGSFTVEVPPYTINTFTTKIVE